MKIGLVALAGAVGALTRFWIGERWGDRAFPWTTLGINLVGSLLLGIVLKVGLDRGWSDNRTVPLSVGFLGAFTTFSTFSYETQDLLRDGRTTSAGIYVAVSVLGGLAAAAIGYAAASAIS